MKWNEVIGLVLALLFLSTLLTSKDAPTLRDTMNNYHWEMYEPDGTRTAWNEILVMKFWKSNYDIQYNDFAITHSPYFVENDSTIYMYNTFFFNDSTVAKVRADLIGLNDMLIYPERDSTKLDTSYIYMKRKIPYQY